MPRNTYDEQFKTDALAKVKETGNRTAVARELGISDATLVNWEKKANGRTRTTTKMKATKAPSSVKMTETGPSETQRLTDENKRLRESNRLLQMTIAGLIIAENKLLS